MTVTVSAALTGDLSADFAAEVVDADAPDIAAGPAAEPVDPAQRRQLIIQTIEDLRPMLQNDGGDMELVEIRDDVVRVGLRGACVGCGLAGQTLGAVRRRLMAVLGEPVRVLPAPL